MAAANKKKKRRGGLSPYLWGGVVLALALTGGAIYLKNITDTPEKNAQQAKPWYKEHAQAPEMIRLPDAPLILAAKDAEIDPTIEELKPKRPLKKKPTPQSIETTALAPSQPRINQVDLSAKPQPPAAIYEEALPQDIYTPTPDVHPRAAQPATVPPQHLQPRWMKYALKVDPSPQKPMIALVIDDLGLDRKRTAQTLALQGPMTMAFIPYAKSLDKQTATARKNGHELLVHLPMEPLNAKIDAGPNHLHTHLAQEDLLDRIHWNLERFDGYVGVNNHMGSRATTDTALMTALMSELRSREMLFLDSRTNAKSVGAKLAAAEGVPFAERNVFLDNVNDKDAVLKQLSILERVSRKTGFSVGIGHPRDGTIAALKEWLPRARDKGFSLVPISQIVLKNQGLT